MALADPRIRLADYTALCAYVLYSYGVGGMIAAATANPVTWAISADLVISLSLVLARGWCAMRATVASRCCPTLLTFALGSSDHFSTCCAGPERPSATPCARPPSRADRSPERFSSGTEGTMLREISDLPPSLLARRGR